MKIEYADFWFLIFSFQKLQYVFRVASALLSFTLASIWYISVVQITRSSAKRALGMLRRGGKSMRKMKKRVHLSSEPCGSHYSSVFLDEVAQSTVVCIVLLLKKIDY